MYTKLTCALVVLRVAVFVGGTVVVVNTLHLVATDVRVAGVTDLAWRTATVRLVVLHATHCRLCALRHYARVRAVRLYTGQRGGAVSVRATLVWAHAAGREVRVADCAWLTRATEGADCVGTNCALVAGIL